MSLLSHLTSLNQHAISYQVANLLAVDSLAVDSLAVVLL